MDNAILVPLGHMQLRVLRSLSALMFLLVLFQLAGCASTPDGSESAGFKPRVYQNNPEHTALLNKARLERQSGSPPITILAMLGSHVDESPEIARYYLKYGVEKHYAATQVARDTNQRSRERALRSMISFGQFQHVRTYWHEFDRGNKAFGSIFITSVLEYLATSEINTASDADRTFAMEELTRFYFRDGCRSATARSATPDLFGTPCAKPQVEKIDRLFNRYVQSHGVVETVSFAAELGDRFFVKKDFANAGRYYKIVVALAAGAPGGYAQRDMQGQLDRVIAEIARSPDWVEVNGQMQVVPKPDLNQLLTQAVSRSRHEYADAVQRAKSRIETMVAAGAL